MNIKGMVLIQVLIFSLLIIITSVTIVDSVKLIAHYNNNYQQQLKRLQSTDTSLVNAEIQLAKLPLHITAQQRCHNKLCVYKLSERNFYDKKFWPTVADNLDQSDQPSYYMIELLTSDIDPKTHFITDYFQITAISWQQQQHSLRIAQRVVSKVFDDQGKAMNETVKRHSWRLVR